MSQQNTKPTFSSNQYLLYIAIGFGIWVTGVILVRVLGPQFFEPGSPLLIGLFVFSVIFGFVLQMIVPPIIRVPMKDSLIPVSVMVATALICDGLAIAFTNVYSPDATIKMAVGGWLLWTFGTQVMASLILIGRANKI